MDGIDWGKIFIPSQPLIETVFRGSLMYLTIFLLLRLLSKEPSSLSISNLLVIVLIADAAQNGMAGGYTSLIDGILLVAVILFWSWLLDVMAFRFPFFQRLVHPPPFPLVKDGRIIPGNLRREFISREELMSQLREQGIDDISAVKSAYVEGDGKISIIRKRDTADGDTP